MMVHSQRTLPENLSAVLGTVQKYRGLGATITAEAMIDIEAKIEMMLEQAQRLSNSRDALIAELLDEQMSPALMCVELPAAADQQGLPSRRMEWAVGEIVRVANYVVKPASDPIRAAQWLRYCAGQLSLVSAAVERNERPVTRRRGFMRLIQGGVA